MELDELKQKWTELSEQVEKNELLNRQIIIDMIQLLGNCSNQNQYEYTQKDVTKIFNAIQSELDEAKKRYNKNASQSGSKFTLE